MKKQLLISLYTLFFCSLSLSSHAVECGDSLLRAQGNGLFPIDSAKEFDLIAGASLTSGEGLGMGCNAISLFTDNLGLELGFHAAWIDLKGSDALSGTKIGKTWITPLTATVQWHFDCYDVVIPEDFIVPYIGVGAAYTTFLNEKSALTDTQFSLGECWAALAQGGVNIFMDYDWFVFCDAKFLLLQTTTKLAGTTEGKAEITLNPVLIGIGMGRRF